MLSARGEVLQGEIDMEYEDKSHLQAVEGRRGRQAGKERTLKFKVEGVWNFANLTTKTRSPKGVYSLQRNRY